MTRDFNDHGTLLKVNIVVAMAKRGNCTSRLQEIFGKDSKIDPVPIPPKKSMMPKIPPIKVPPAIQSGVLNIVYILGGVLGLLLIVVIAGIVIYFKCVKANSEALNNVRVALDNTRRIGDMVEMQTRTATQAIKNQNKV